MDKIKRIALIGPVYPFKGGISHYTGLLFRALNKKHETVMISYKLQYPKFLYKKEQRDYANEDQKIPNSLFIINTMNPLNWFNCARKIRKKDLDLLIVQWWHPYFAPCYWLLFKLLQNVKILFICHNVYPHERFPIDRFLTKRVLELGDYFIVHSEQDFLDLQEIKRNAAVKRTALPTFSVFKQKNMSKQEARASLGLGFDVPVLLFFGFVREYKGLKYLLKAMPQTIGMMSDINLLVVGDFSEDKQEYLILIEELGIKNNVLIFDGYIPDSEVEKFFAACDLVVLPYTSATQSGIVQVAYDFEKPVLVTDVGGLPEVVENEKTGFVVESNNSMVLSEKIIEYFQLDKGCDFSRHIREEAYKYSWDHLLEVMDELLSE